MGGFAFQFQYGLIKRHLRRIVKRQMSQFQFQYGLIKRQGAPAVMNNHSLFQFQYGLIKSVVIESLSDEFSDFNSNMV